MVRRFGRQITRLLSVRIVHKQLVNMLESAPKELIRWSNDGHSFVVIDKERLAKEVLPQYYKTSNFSSFVRQLNFYRFTKVVIEGKKDRKSNEGKKERGKGKDKSAQKSNREHKSKWEFLHKNFIRGRPDLLMSIKRRTYQDVDANRQIQSLQNQVSGLNSKVEHLTEEVSTLKQLIAKLVGSRKSGNGEEEGEEIRANLDAFVSSTSRGLAKKRKRSFDADESSTSPEQMVRLNSDGIVMNANSGVQYSTEELAQFLDGLEFQTDENAASTPSSSMDVVDQTSTLSEPSLVRCPSWNTVCKQQSDVTMEGMSTTLRDDVSKLKEDPEKIAQLLTIFLPQIQAQLMSTMNLTGTTIGVKGKETS